MGNGLSSTSSRKTSVSFLPQTQALDAQKPATQAASGAAVADKPPTGAATTSPALPSGGFQKIDSGRVSFSQTAQLVSTGPHTDAQLAERVRRPQAELAANRAQGEGHELRASDLMRLDRRGATKAPAKPSKAHKPAAAQLPVQAAPVPPQAAQQAPVQAAPARPPQSLGRVGSGKLEGHFKVGPESKQEGKLGPFNTTATAAAQIAGSGSAYANSQMGVGGQFNASANLGVEMGAQTTAYNGALGKLDFGGKLTAGVQASAQGEVQVGPRDVTAALQAQASLGLGARADMTFKSAPIRIGAQDLRVDFKVDLQALAGAMAKLDAAAGVTSGGSVEDKLEKLKKDGFKVKMDASEMPPKPIIQAEGKVFAGVSAGAMVKTEVQWLNPPVKTRIHSLDEQSRQLQHGIDGTKAAQQKLAERMRHPDQLRNVAYKEIHRDVAQLKGDIKSATAEIAYLNTGLAGDLAKQKETVQNLQTQKTALEKRAKDLETTLPALGGLNVQESPEKRGQRLDELLKVKDQLGQVSAQFADARSKLDSLQDSSDNKSLLLQAKAATVEDANTKIEQHQQNLHRLRDRTMPPAQMAQLAQPASERLDQQLAALNRDQAGVQGQMAQARQMQSVLAQKTAELKDVNQSLQRLQSSPTLALGGGYGSRQQTIAQLQARQQTLRTEVGALQQGQTHQGNYGTNAQVQQLRTELTQTEASLRKAMLGGDRKLSQDLHQAVGRLRGELQTAEAALRQENLARPGIPLLAFEGKAEVKAGAGAQFKANLGFDKKGMLGFGAEAGATLGLGFGAGVDGRVNPYALPSFVLEAGSDLLSGRKHPDARLAKQEAQKLLDSLKH